MVQEYGLNVVGLYETATPDLQAQVPNPAHRALTATLKALAQEKKRLTQALGKAYAQNGHGGSAADLARQLHELEASRKKLLKQRRSTPATVAASEAGRSRRFSALNGGRCTTRWRVSANRQAFQRVCTDLNRMNPVTQDHFQFPIRFMVD